MYTILGAIKPVISLFDIITLTTNTISVKSIVFLVQSELHAIVDEFDCSPYDFFHNVHFKQGDELKELGQNFFSLYYKINSTSVTKRVIKCSDILSKCILP